MLQTLISKQKPSTRKAKGETLYAFLLLAFLSVCNAKASPITKADESIGKKLELASTYQAITPDVALTTLDFQVSERKVPNYAFSTETIWAKFSIDWQDLPQEIFLEHRYVHTDLVELYQIEEDRISLMGRAGDRINKPESVAHYFPVFKLKKPETSNIANYLVKAHSLEATTLPLFINTKNPHIYESSILDLLRFSLLPLVIILLFVFAYLGRSSDFKRPSIFYLFTCIFFFLNHIFIQGVAKKYFPELSQSYLMNEFYFQSASLYQIGLASAYFCLIKRPLKKLEKKAFLVLLISSCLILISTLVIDYQWTVIPYFTNAMAWAITIAISALYRLNQSKEAFVRNYILSWLPGFLVTLGYIYFFLSDGYQHSFAFYYVGLFHFLFMALLLNLSPASEVSKCKSM